MKYMKNNYDRIELKVPKGRKAELQEHAQQQGESLNGFVNRAIDETVERDKEAREAEWAEIQAWEAQRRQAGEGGEQA